MTNLMTNLIWCWIASKQQWATYGPTDCQTIAELRALVKYPFCFALSRRANA